MISRTVQAVVLLLTLAGRARPRSRTATEQIVLSVERLSADLHEQLLSRSDSRRPSEIRADGPLRRSRSLRRIAARSRSDRAGWCLLDVVFGGIRASSYISRATVLHQAERPSITCSKPSARIRSGLPALPGS